MSNYANYNQKITNVVSNIDNNALIQNQINDLKKQKEEIEQNLNKSSEQYLKELASKGVVNPIDATKYKAQIEANKNTALKELTNEYNTKVAELDKSIIKSDYIFDENAIKTIAEQNKDNWKITKNTDGTNIYIKTDTYKPYKDQKTRLESYDKETYVFKDGKPLEYIEKETISRDNGNKKIDEAKTLKFDNFGRVTDFVEYDKGEKQRAEFYTFNNNGEMNIKSKDYSSKKETEKTLKQEIPVIGQIYTDKNGKSYVQSGTTALDVVKNESTGKYEYKDINKATESLKTEMPSVYNKEVKNAYEQIGIKLTPIEIKKPEIINKQTEISNTNNAKIVTNTKVSENSKNFFSGLRDYFAEATGNNNLVSTETKNWENKYKETAKKLEEIGEGIDNYDKALEPKINEIKKIQEEYLEENKKGKNADIDKLNALAKREEEIFKDKNFEKMQTRYNELVNKYQDIYNKEYEPLKKNTPYIYKNADETADTESSTQMTNADKFTIEQNNYQSKLEFAEKYNINPKTKSGQLKSREQLYEEKGKIDNIKNKYSNTYKDLDKIDEKLTKYTKYAPLLNLGKDVTMNGAKLSVNLGQGAEEFYQTYKNLDNTEDKKIIKNKEIKKNIIKELAKNIIKNKTEQAKNLINENKDKTVEKTNILEKINPKFNINKNNLDKDQTKEASAMMGATTEVIAREGKDGVVSVGKFFKDVTVGLYKIGNEYLAVELPKKQEIIAKQKFKEMYNREPTNTIMDSNRMATIAMKDLVIDKPKNAIENTYVFMKDENNRLMLIPAAATIAAKFTKGEIDRFSKQPFKVAIEYDVGWKEAVIGGEKIISKTKEALSPIKNEAVKKIKQTAETINNTKVKFQIKEKIPTNPEELANSIKARELSKHEIIAKIQSIVDKDMAELAKSPDVTGQYNPKKKALYLNRNLTKEEIIQSKIHEKVHMKDENLNKLKNQEKLLDDILKDIEKANELYPERTDIISSHMDETLKYKKKQVGSEMLARFAETYPEEIMRPTTQTGRYLKKRLIDEEKFQKVLSITVRKEKPKIKNKYDIRNPKIEESIDTYQNLDIELAKAKSVFLKDKNKKSFLNRLGAKLETRSLLKKGTIDIDNLKNELNVIEDKIKFEAVNKKNNYETKRKKISELKNLHEIKKGEIERAIKKNELVKLADNYKFNEKRKKELIKQIKNEYGYLKAKQFRKELQIDKFARIKASGKNGAIIPDFEHQTKADFKVDNINKQINKNNKTNLEADRFVDENGKVVDFKEYNNVLKTEKDIKLFKQRLLKHYRPENFVDIEAKITQTPTTKDGTTKGVIETSVRPTNQKSKRYDISEFETKTEKISNPEKKYSIDTDFYDYNTNYYNKLNNVLPEGKQKLISQKIDKEMTIPERNYEVNKGKITKSRRNNKYKFEFKTEQTKQNLKNPDITKFKHTQQGKRAARKIKQDGVSIETHYDDKYSIATKKTRLRGKDNVMQGGTETKGSNTYAKAEAELGIMNKRTESYIKLNGEGKPQKVLLPQEESLKKNIEKKLKQSIKTAKEAQKFEKNPTKNSWLNKNKKNEFKNNKTKTYINIKEKDSFESPNKGELITRKENELNNFKEKEKYLETKISEQINPEFNKFSQEAWAKLKKKDPIKYLQYRNALDRNKILMSEGKIKEEIKTRPSMTKEEINEWNKKTKELDKQNNFQNDWKNSEYESQTRTKTSKQKKEANKKAKLEAEKNLIKKERLEELELQKLEEDREKWYEERKLANKNKKTPEIKLFKNNKEFIADKYYGKKYSELTEQQKINTDLYNAGDKAYLRDELLFVKKPSELPPFELQTNTKYNVIPQDIQKIATINKESLTPKQKIMLDTYIKSHYNQISSSLAKYLDKNILPEGREITKLASKHNVSEATISKMLAIKIAYENYKEIGQNAQTNELLREQLNLISQSNLKEEVLKFEVKQLLEEQMKQEILQRELQEQRNLQEQELTQVKVQKPEIPQNLKLKNPGMPKIEPVKRFELRKFKFKDKDSKKKSKNSAIKKSSYMNKRVNDPLYRLTGKYAYNPIEQKRMSQNMGSFYSGVNVEESQGYKTKSKKKFQEEKKFLSQADLMKIKNKKITQSAGITKSVNPYKEKKYSNNNNSKQMQKIMAKKIFRKR